MKQYILIILLGGIMIPGVLFAMTTAEPTSTTKKARLFTSQPIKGESSDSVRELQYILKSDPTIYPEGLTTGYYGTLTEKAVMNLQKKYNLPATGILDEKTQEILFPTNTDTELVIVKPNGGEIWDKSEIHTISWKSSIGAVTLDGRQVLPKTQSNTAGTAPSIAPFFPRASLDLIKDSDSSFIRHIATVDLYQSQYSWKIPMNIPEGKDYRVRISVGGDVPCLYLYDKAITNMHSSTEPSCSREYPRYSSSDKSDRTFSITGVNIPQPPTNDTVTKLKQQVAEMERVIQQLLNQVRNFSTLLRSL